MKIRFALTLLAVLTVAGCKPPPPPVNDDTLVSSTVNGVTLVHRHAVNPPAEFTPVDETWRDTQLIGYVPMKVGVAADRYEEALRNDRPRPRRASKQVCVDVGGASKACRKANTATWILD